MEEKVIDLDEIWKIKLSGKRIEEIHHAVTEEMRALCDRLIKRGFTDTNRERQYMVATLFTELLIYAFIDHEEDMDGFLKFINAEAREEMLLRRDDLSMGRILSNLETKTLQ